MDGLSIMFEYDVKMQLFSRFPILPKKFMFLRANVFPGTLISHISIVKKIARIRPEYREKYFLKSITI